MKILYCTDLHLQYSNPVSRTDCYRESLYNKIQEVVQIGKDNKIGLLIFGGDFAHSPLIEFSFVKEYLLSLLQFQCLFVIGNHDYTGNFELSRSKGLIGFLLDLGILVDKFEGDDVLVEAFHFLDQPDRKYIIQSDKLKIAAVHEMIVKDPYFGDYVLTKDVQTNAEFFLVGHYHSGFEKHVVNETTFINPGSLCRNSAIPDNFDRDLQIILIDAQLKTSNLVKLKNYQRDVFDVKKITRMKKTEKEFDQFIEKISGQNILSKYDPIIIAEELAKSIDVSKEVLREFKTRYEKARSLKGV